MKSRVRKLIGILAAAAMVITLFPVQASAATATGQITIQGTKLTDLGSAHNGNGNSGTYAWDPENNTLTLTNFQSDNSLSIQCDQDVTIKYVGDCQINPTAGNSVTLSGTGKYTFTGSGGTFTFHPSTYSMGISTESDLTFDGGTYSFDTLHASIYSAGTANLTVQNGAKIDSLSSYSSILMTNGDISITGETTTVSTESQYQNLVANNITINGATVTCVPEAGTSWATAILQANKSLTITNATVSACGLDPNDPSQKAGGIYVGDELIVNSGSNLAASSSDNSIYVKNNATISDSAIDLNSSVATAMYSGKDTTFTNVTGSIVSDPVNGGNCLLAKNGNLTIGGDNTNLKFHSKAPLTAGQVLSITGGKVDVLTEGGVCLYGKQKIDITGGTLTVRQLQNKQFFILIPETFQSQVMLM